MKGGCANIVKFIMILFNFIFFVSGCALLGVATWILLDGRSFEKLLSVTNSAFFSAVWIMLIVGGSLAVIGFLGCCGAYKENKCLIFLFFILILIVFLVEVVGGILAVFFVAEVEQYMDDQIRNKYGNLHKHRITTDNWNALQSVWECCGIYGPEDWNATSWVWQKYPQENATLQPFAVQVLSEDGSLFAETQFDNAKWLAKADGQYLPESCCKRKSIVGKGDTLLNRTLCLNWSPEDPESFMDFIHTEGCKVKASTYFLLTGIVALCIMVVELFGMLLSCCLYRGIVASIHLRDVKKHQRQNTGGKVAG